MSSLQARVGAAWSEGAETVSEMQLPGRGMNHVPSWRAPYLWIMVALVALAASVAGLGVLVVTYRSEPCVSAILHRPAALSTWDALERCQHRAP